jgi:integrase
MARTQKIPQLCRHKKRDYAFVVDPETGRQVYMGPWGTVEANRKYAAWVSDFIRRTKPVSIASLSAPKSIGELVARWLEYCGQTYKRADGKPTGEIFACIRAAELLQPMADKPIEEFTRAHLLDIRQQLIDRSLSKQTIKHYVSRICRCFRWGSDREWVDVDQALRLERLPTLRGDQGVARKVLRGIPRKHIFQILRNLKQSWRPLFLWHLLTGQRVETALAVSVQELNRQRTPWVYTPSQHKNLAKGLPLTIMVGPRARKVLEPILQDKSQGFLFPGRSALSGVAYRGPRQYSGYAAAMTTACKHAGIPHYTPRQVRHTSATFLVSKLVPEAIIGAILGHHGKSDDEAISTGSHTITGRYAAAPRWMVESVVEKWG